MLGIQLSESVNLPVSHTDGRIDHKELIHYVHLLMKQTTQDLFLIPSCHIRPLLPLRRKQASACRYGHGMDMGAAPLPSDGYANQESFCLTRAAYLKMLFARDLSLTRRL